MISVKHFLVAVVNHHPFVRGRLSYENMKCWQPQGWIPSLISYSQSVLFISWSAWSRPSIPPSLHSQMCLWPSGGGRPSLPGHRALCRPPVGPVSTSGTALPAPRRPGRLSEPWWWRRLWSGPPCESDETLPASRRYGGCWWGWITNELAFCRASPKDSHRHVSLAS